MLLARVIGNATSTVKHPSMESWRLLVVQALAADGRSPDGDPQLVVDSLGAARGDMVMISSDGKWTRELVGSETTPVRWCVIGIKD
jgi:ethanolamine utilization protein EutN